MRGKLLKKWGVMQNNNIDNLIHKAKHNHFNQYILSLNIGLYIVGGAVRDCLLGLEPHDIDYVITNITKEQLGNLYKIGFKEIGKDFPVLLSPDNHEYALARQERKQGIGYKGFIFLTDNVSIEDDLRRRDLTINSMAINLKTHQTIDLFEGIKDINCKIIRHTSEAFAEDPLRILRVARFISQFPDFTLDEKTEIYLKKIISLGELKHLTPDRVWIETKKALSAVKPSNYFRILAELDALKYIYPEIDNMRGIPQPVEFHKGLDVFKHTLDVLDNVSKYNDPLLNFAALMHDIGKTITDKNNYPHHFGHDDLGAELLIKIKDKYKIPNDYFSLAFMTAKYHMRIHGVRDIKKPGKLYKLIKNLNGLKDIEKLINIGKVCIADNGDRKDIDYLINICMLLQEDDYSYLLPLYKGKELGEQIKQRYIYVCNACIK